MKKLFYIPPTSPYYPINSISHLYPPQPAKQTRLRLAYVISFLLIAPLTILSSFLLVFARSSHSITTPQVLAAKDEIPQLPQTSPAAQIYAPLPRQTRTIYGKPEAQDARVEIVRQYLNKYSSPLEPFALSFVAEADRFGFDYRLLVAIAQQESNLCKKIPPESYNCWGWGIHSQGTLKFSSYQEAIETVSRGLREDYIDSGLLTPDQIMTKYTPLSNGSWATAVNQFLTEME